MSFYDPVGVAAVIGAVTGVGSLIVTVVKLRQDARQIAAFQQLVTSLTRVVHTYEGEVASLRSELDVLKKRIEKKPEPQSEKLELEKRKIAQKERDSEWRRMRDVAKGIGWLLDSGDSE